MQYIKIIGGLGNQLFQYAFALNLSKKNKVGLDANIFKFYKYHDLSLQNLNLKLEFASWKEVRKFYFLNNIFFTYKIQILSRKIFRLISKIIKKNYIFEEEYVITEELNKSFLFDGYWQRLKYINQAGNDLIQLFDIKIKNEKHEKLLNIISNYNSVAIHLRSFTQKKGDYHLVLNKDYYDQAIKIINNKVINPKYFIFSDSPQLIKKCINLKDINYEVISDFKDYEDIISISRCKHQIIANSTFSWWGAWLNKNRTKIVICPKKWNKTNDSQSENLILSNWIKV